MEPQVVPMLYANGPPALPGPAVLTTRRVRPRAPADVGRVGLAAVAVIPIWLGCLVVGILGMLLPYHRAHLPAKQRPPVVAEPVPVLLVPAKQMAPPETEAPQISPKPAAAAPPPDVMQPPSPPDAAAPSEAPALAEVATPSPAVAFAVPVEGPARIVDAKHAMPAARSSAVAPAPVRHLTFGVGEGQQPDPEYPFDAQLAGQQGTVVVRFTVGQDGRVQSAQVTKPSRWPLLNRAALRAVRDHWFFGPGKARVFDVRIEFKFDERKRTE